MLKTTLVAGGLAVSVAACGSSSATTPAASSNSAPTSARTSATATAAAASAPPSVGPTDPHQSPGPKPTTIDLQVVKRNGAAVILAPVVIHGRTYSFIVDTGATVTLVDQSYAAALGLKKIRAAPIPVVGVTGSGSAFLATISDWQIGRAKIPTSTSRSARSTSAPASLGCSAQTCSPPSEKSPSTTPPRRLLSVSFRCRGRSQQ